MIIPSHNSHSIVDSTKLKSYIECPRAYFYEYILGWRHEQPNVHLEFGKAWHYAMEYLLLHEPDAKAVSEAWDLLLAHYRKFFSKQMDEVLAPKNPACALLALMGYVKEYKPEWRTQKVLYTEIGGTVAVDDKRVIHFRMDSILEQGGLIKSREHKTGSTPSRTWTDQWALAVQTWVYNHVLYSLFPREQVWGVEINGTFLQKKESKFLRVPARRSLEMMEAGYWDVLYWMDELDKDMQRLYEDCEEGDVVMKCFPKRSPFCTSYFGCKYMDFCTSWPNPLQHIEEPPLGFKIEYWDPRQEETKVKFDVGGMV